MDLGTISKNIDARRYITMGQLAYDIELVFEKCVEQVTRRRLTSHYSCRQFNNPGDAVTALADALESVYWQEWPMAVCLQMTAGERKDMMGMLGKATRDARSLYFRTAGTSWCPRPPSSIDPLRSRPRCSPNPVIFRHVSSQFGLSLLIAQNPTGGCSRPLTYQAQARQGTLSDGAPSR